MTLVPPVTSPHPKVSRPPSSNRRIHFTSAPQPPTTTYPPQTSESAPHTTATMPPKNFQGKGRTLQEPNFAQTALRALTSAENRSVVGAIGMFAVSYNDPGAVLWKWKCGAIALRSVSLNCGCGFCVLDWTGAVLC
ncbi:hypothetical protein NX059_006214 [Plenodomus lindquistii]|nr:hypothetical protein NX059_006214 [Plenodomus lindquistii]